jgi:hypothetical protein
MTIMDDRTSSYDPIFSLIACHRAACVVRDAAMAELDKCEDDEIPLEELMLNVVAIERGLLADLLAAMPTSVLGMVAAVRYDGVVRQWVELGYSDDGWGETLLANLAAAVRLAA